MTVSGAALCDTKYELKSPFRRRRIQFSDRLLDLENIQRNFELFSTSLGYISPHTTCRKQMRKLSTEQPRILIYLFRLKRANWSTNISVFLDAERILRRRQRETRIPSGMPAGDGCFWLHYYIDAFVFVFFSVQVLRKGVSIQKYILFSCLKKRGFSDNQTTRHYSIFPVDLITLSPTIDAMLCTSQSSKA